MTLNEIRAHLAKEQIRLTKSLGQNFLHDANQLNRIAEAGDIQPGDPVLEIGPGLGPLTVELLERNACVLAIEKDKRLVDFLHTEFADVPRLEIVHADALELLKTEKRDWGTWKMVSNLPYSVASPLLVELAWARQGPKRMSTTVQWEVALRIAAQPDSDDYGLLTLMLQLDYRVSGLFKIPAACFFPRPKIDSACVTLQRLPSTLLDAERHAYKKAVKRAFSERRKMMMKLLKTEWPAPALENAFKTAGLSPQVRAEKVSRDEFIVLAQSLVEQTGD